MTRLRDSLARPAASLARDVLDFLLPQRCPGCGEPADASQVLCDPCRARIPRFGGALCARCLLAGGDGESCARHTSARVFAPWLWDERAAAVVHALKFGGRTRIARPLGAWLASSLPPAWRRPALIVAVPLHRARERERGYNQSALLADALAAEIGAPRTDAVLVRRIATRAQSRLGAAERRTQLKDAFAAPQPGWLRGRRVLVVDDVITTGATLAASLATLHDAGAEAAGVALVWAP